MRHHRIRVVSYALIPYSIASLAWSLVGTSSLSDPASRARPRNSVSPSRARDPRRIPGVATLQSGDIANGFSCVSARHIYQLPLVDADIRLFFDMIMTGPAARKGISMDQVIEKERLGIVLVGT